MITQGNIQESVRLMDTLVHKAQASVSFKNQLIANPHEAINQVDGNWTITKDKRVIVEDQMSDSFIYFNIPPEPNFDEMELSEEQLEMVAGGCTPSAIALVGLFVTAYIAGRGDKRDADEE